MIVLRLVLLVLFLLLPGLVRAQPRGEVLQLPVSPACVSSPFGMRFMPNRPLADGFHKGIDLPAPLGTRVRAVAPGELIRVQRHGVGGLEMLVQHDGFVGVYSHLGLIAPAILEGKRRIEAGDWIGTVGMTGLTYGPHLYFGIFVGDQPVDPAPLLHVGACGGVPVVRDPRIPPSRFFGATTHQIVSRQPVAHPVLTHPAIVRMRLARR